MDDILFIIIIFFQKLYVQPKQYFCCFQRCKESRMDDKLLWRQAAE